MAVEKQNIVTFPFMAQGHLIPFLSLALKLEQERGYSITFVNTPLNIKKLRHNLPKSSNIRLLELPFDSTEHGLPPNSESTEMLPPTLMLRLIESSPALKPAFKDLISVLIAEKAPPVCVISDIFFAWSADVAHEFGLLHAIFNAGGGFGMAGFHTTWLNLPYLEPLNSEEFQMPGFPRGCMFKTRNLPEHQLALKGPWRFGLDTLQDWKKTDAMLFNTVEGIDQTGLTYFREQFPDCLVYAIGPVVSPVGSKARAGQEAEETRNLCLQWLDSKPKNSVLYVAFGSQSDPSEKQTFELAKALESSNVNFLWVYRPPPSSEADSPSSNPTSIKSPLPVGFEERMKNNNKGLLLKKWAPQVDILSHKSVGGFLSHCGWNSIIEALSNGVPILSWPMGAEQQFNAKCLEDEMRVCVGVANGTSCEVKCGEVVEKIEAVMSDETGDVMRRKAFKVKEIIGIATNGSSVRAMDEFLNTLFLRTRKKLGRLVTN